MKSKIKVCISIVCCILFGVFFYYQYKKVNYGVPLDYNIQKYSMNQSIKLDDFEVKVDSVNSKYEDDTANISNLVIVNVNIKNLSDKEKSLEDFIYGSRLVCGTSVIDVPILNDKKEDSRVIGRNEAKDIVLQYNIPEKNVGKEMKFYFPKTLYQHEIKEDLKSLKMCEKYVELAEVNN